MITNLKIEETDFGKSNKSKENYEVYFSATNKTYLVLIVVFVKNFSNCRVAMSVN